MEERKELILRPKITIDQRDPSYFDVITTIVRAFNSKQDHKQIIILEQNIAILIENFSKELFNKYEKFGKEFARNYEKMNLGSEILEIIKNAELATACLDYKALANDENFKIDIIFKIFKDNIIKLKDLNKHSIGKTHGEIFQTEFQDRLSILKKSFFSALNSTGCTINLAIYDELEKNISYNKNNKLIKALQEATQKANSMLNDRHIKKKDWKALNNQMGCLSKKIPQLTKLLILLEDPPKLIYSFDFKAFRLIAENKSIECFNYLFESSKERRKKLFELASCAISVSEKLTPLVERSPQKDKLQSLKTAIFGKNSPIKVFSNDCKSILQTSILSYFQLITRLVLPVIELKKIINDEYRDTPAKNINNCIKELKFVINIINMQKAAKEFSKNIELLIQKNIEGPHMTLNKIKNLFDVLAIEPSVGRYRFNNLNDFFNKYVNLESLDKNTEGYRLLIKIMDYFKGLNENSNPKTKKTTKRKLNFSPLNTTEEKSQKNKAIELKSEILECVQTFKNVLTNSPSLNPYITENMSNNLIELHNFFTKSNNLNTYEIKIQENVKNLAKSILQPENKAMQDSINTLRQSLEKLPNNMKNTEVSKKSWAFVGATIGAIITFSVAAVVTFFTIGLGAPLALLIGIAAISSLTGAVGGATAGHAGAKRKHTNLLINKRVVQENHARRADLNSKVEEFIDSTNYFK